MCLKYSQFMKFISTMKNCLFLCETEKCENQENRQIRNKICLKSKKEIQKNGIKKMMDIKKGRF